MYENIGVAARALARFVQQFGPGGPQTGDGGGEVRNTEGHMMQAGPALFEEFRDGGIRGRGLQQLDARIGGRQHGDVDFFLRDGFAMGHGEAKGFVEGDGFVEGANGDA